MTFLCILFALLIEQVRPLQTDSPVYEGVKDLAARFERGFNADRLAHGRLAWLGMMAVLVIPVLLMHWLAWRLSPFAAFAWNVLVLYLTLGFRHYSHRFSSIQFALNTGDMQTARTLLADWTGQKTENLGPEHLLRLAIEKALLTSHRHVFGVFFWFLLPIGPAGAVLYRVADYLARAWNERSEAQQGAFGNFAARAFYWIDWIPVRLSATAFAVVGNFEEALFAWRNVAARSRPASGISILLAAGGGAMGINLERISILSSCSPAAIARISRSPTQAPGFTAATHDEARLKHGPPEDLTPFSEDVPTLRTLQSTVSLVWRALVLWLLLLLLLSLAASWG